VADKVQLSNGGYAEIPDGTDPKDIPTIAANAEAKLAQIYGAQADKQGYPVVTDGKIYSSSTTYNNGPMGHMMAWLDMNVPGVKWLNQNVVQPVDRAQTAVLGAPLEAPIGRIESNAVAGAADLPGAIINTVKHYTPVGDKYDVPSIAGNIRNQFSVPELSPNAPFWQRAGEATASALASGGTSLAPSALRAAPGVTGAVTRFVAPRLAAPLTAGKIAKDTLLGVGGTYAGDVGGEIGGEGGSMAANILAMLGMGAFGKGVAKAVAPGVRSEEAPTTWANVEAIKPTTPGGNFQGLTSAPPTGMPDYSNYHPSFTALANPAGQRAASSFSGVPFAGAPVEQATEGTRQFIKNARDATAADLMSNRGGPAPGEVASPSTIGPVVTRGAQTAIHAINVEKQRQQQAMERTMTGPEGPGSAEVPLRGTYDETRAQTRGNRFDTGLTNEIRGIGDEIASQSPGGPAYERNPNVPLPAEPSLPWSNISNMVTRWNEAFGSGNIPDHVLSALKTVANLERERAADAMSPGAGAQFRQNNIAYAQAIERLNALLPIGGRERGVTNQFENVPKEQTAAGEVTRNMQSPSYFEHTLLDPRFPAADRLNIAGQIVSGLGNYGSPPDLRPEYFPGQYSGKTGVRPGLEALTTQPSGAPHPAMRILDAADQISRQYMPPTSRFGLTKNLGTAAVVGKLVEKTGDLAAYLSQIPAAKVLGVPLARLYTQGLESEALRRAMARQPQDWTTLANRIPNLATNVATQAPNLRKLHRTVTVTRP
jgi:hypothetical protein